jgi:hypothetical protein
LHRVGPHRRRLHHHLHQKKKTDRANGARKRQWSVALSSSAQQSCKMIRVSGAARNQRQNRLACAVGEH